MKKIIFTLILVVVTSLILVAQNTSDLLVRAVEKLQDEKMVVAQSVTIDNLEQINSDQLDYSPVLYKDGILFTSNRKSEDRKSWGKVFGKKSKNLFFAEKIKDGSFNPPAPIQGKFRGKTNEGAVTIDEAGSLMFYTVKGNSKGSEPGLAELNLYYTKFENGKWSKGKEVPLNWKGSKTCHPSLSPDAKTLYFASNRPGGYGGMDIYKSEFVDGEWQLPVNLGPKINSPQNEVFPFIHFNGTLYFSSNGKSDAMNLDIYFSRIDETGKWIEAVNIGKPFNSTADDFGFVIEKEGLSGLFSSDREGGKGKDDIYFWRMDQSLEQALDLTPVKFSIIDEASGEFLPYAKVSLVEFENIQFNFSEAEGAIAFVSDITQALANLLGQLYIYQTDENGNFYHDLKHERNYMLLVEKEGYKHFRKMTTYNRFSGIKDIGIALSTPNTIEQESPIKATIDLASTEEIDEFLSTETELVAVKVEDEALAEIFTTGQKITLNNIYYEYGKAALKPESTAVLDETAQMLKNFPEMEINLMSHTDARGNANFNKSLSQQRADAAREYLIAQGIAAERVKAIGLGEEELINGCFDGINCTEDLHSQNRRTEIVITKINPANEIFVKKE